MSVVHVGVFCGNLGITAFTLENYSNFNNKFLFNYSSIFKINDYYKNRGREKVSFNELCEIINALSNQDFTGLDKFRLMTSLGKIKEMRVKRNNSNSSAGESASLTWGKADSLESKLLTESSEKMSCLQETASLLNKCIGEKNQGWLQNDKELKILGKKFKKQMKENKSLTLKFCQKK